MAETQKNDDLTRATECLAAFSNAWDSSDIYIVTAPVNEKGSITIDTKELRLGRLLHLSTGSLKVGDKNYSAFLWDGGEHADGGVIGGQDWEEGRTWEELAGQSGAELLRGDYGVSVTGGSPTALWAVVVVSELWDTKWRKPAPGDRRFLFPAYTASIETWKRIIRKREQKASSVDENDGLPITVPVVAVVGLAGLVSWFMYRRNRLGSKEKPNIASPDHASKKVAVLRKFDVFWHDPVWSAVIAGGILASLGLLGSYVFGWLSWD